MCIDLKIIQIVKQYIYNNTIYEMKVLFNERGTNNEKECAN